MTLYRTAAHALMTIGPAMIMIEAEWPGLASRAPKPDGSPSLPAWDL